MAATLPHLQQASMEGAGLVTDARMPRLVQGCRAGAGARAVAASPITKAASILFQSLFP